MDQQIRKLRQISRLKPGQIRKLIKEADLNLIKTLVEIVYNLALGNIEISSKDRRALDKSKKFLATLANLKTGFEAKF